MEAEWIGYAVAGLGIAYGIWKGFGKIAGLTETDKDDAVFEKVDPFVKQGVKVVEQFTGKDIDGDGVVGKNEGE